jgi:hypothetical protein
MRNLKVVKLIAVLSCLVLLGVACGGDEPEEEQGGDTVAAQDAPDQVTGVLLDVQSESLDEITGFTLKDGDQVYEILIDDRIEYGFDLGHLREHLRTGDPLSVPLEAREGNLYAVSIDDA